MKNILSENMLRFGVKNLNKLNIKNLTEQIVTNFDSTYDYKKEGDNFFTKKKNSSKWTKVSGAAKTAIQTKVFKDKKSSATTTGGSSRSDRPDDVLAFQQYANAQGYTPKLKEDGLWGPKTSKAWKKHGTDFNASDRTTTPDIISSYITPFFADQINLNNISSTDTTDNICKTKGGQTQCAKFVNNFSDRFKAVGNAWTAYANDSILGKTIFSKFRGLNRLYTLAVIKLWYSLHKNKPSKGKTDKLYDDANKIVSRLVGGKGYNGPALQVDDIVGLYYPDSKYHGVAFYQGGKRWFTDTNTANPKPGKTILGGNAWGMNTHIGIVGAMKDGVPLIFHNVDGNVKSDPAKNLYIAWVKRK